MNHTHHHSISNGFFLHGIQGVETHHKTDRLMADINAHQIIGDLGDVGTASALRHRIGGMMVAFGAAIAGKTHDIQERQATMPSPTSAKSGFVPTR